MFVDEESDEVEEGGEGQGVICGWRVLEDETADAVGLAAGTDCEFILGLLASGQY